MNRSFILFLFLSLFGPLSGLAGSSSPETGEDTENEATGSNKNSPRRIYCQGIRDEPGTPTYAFELLRRSGGNYEARYLNLPGDEQAPPEVVASIPGLKCRFYSKNRYHFQCEKFGASIESIRIREQKLSLISNSLRTSFWREFRAIGNEVPNVYLVYRFGAPDSCQIR